MISDPVSSAGSEIQFKLPPVTSLRAWPSPRGVESFVSPRSHTKRTYSQEGPEGLMLSCQSSYGEGQETNFEDMNISNNLANVTGFQGHGQMASIRSGQHRFVYTFDKKYKPCVCCALNKVKSPKGWYIYTYYKCEACDVPLCKSKRDCFNLYHQNLNIFKHKPESKLLY